MGSLARLPLLPFVSMFSKLDVDLKEENLREDAYSCPLSKNFTYPAIRVVEVRDTIPRCFTDSNFHLSR